MILSELLFHLAESEKNAIDREILSITQKAEEADGSSLFICIKGARFDGHAYAKEAYRNGCRAFLAEKDADLDLPDGGASVFRAENTRKALAAVACRFFGNPTEKMKVVGITGTKGKTTTALLTAHILKVCGQSCGYIGTNGILFAGEKRATENTTPDAITLQKTFSEMLEKGVRNAVVEVSSQALKQYRADGIKLSAAVMSNLSVDHVGATEHPNYEDYKNCKKRLFTDFSPEKTICFSDHGEADALLCDLTEKIVCAKGNEGDYRVQNVTPIQEETCFGVRFDVETGGKKGTAFLPMIGTCNAENAALALAIAKEVYGVSVAEGIKALKTASVAGRSEVYRLKNQSVAVIDYAHNKDSMERLLSSLREYLPRRLICLFGSVGERTQIRRHELGEVASRLADLCILTSDNPGREDPMAIIRDILDGFGNRKTPFLCIPDRERAIREAVKMSEPGDVLVLAGKGQENYQLIGDEKKPFSEKEILLGDSVFSLLKEG